MTYKVAVVNASDGAAIAPALYRGISLIGWTPAPGRNYLLKPNMLNSKDSASGVTTDPRLVKAAIAFLQDKGYLPRVGDSPGNAYPGKAKKVFKESGMMEVVTSLGAIYVDFEDISPELITPDGQLIDLVGIAKPIMQHRVINMPKLKTHVQTLMTGSVKNIVMGSIQGSGKGAIHKVGNTPERFGKAIMDVYSALRPVIDLNIMDAIICMDGNGPSSGSPKAVGRILIGTDAVAVDMVAFRMAGVDPMRVPYIREAVDRSLGPASFDEIEVLGDAPTVTKFRLPSSILSSVTLYGHSLVSHYKSPVSFTRSRCTRCGECAGICPTKAILLSPYPEVEVSKCIACYSCHEVCEHNAVKVRKGIIIK